MVSEEHLKMVILISAAGQERISKRHDSSQNWYYSFGWWLGSFKVWILRKSCLLQRKTIISNLSCPKERFAAVMASPSPLQLRKIVQIVPPTEKPSAALPTHPTSVNSTRNSAWPKDSPLVLRSVTWPKPLHYNTAEWTGRLREFRHISGVCPGMQRWLLSDHDHNHINSTFHLRVRTGSALTFYLTEHVGKMLERHHRT